MTTEALLSNFGKISMSLANYAGKTLVHVA